MPVLTFADFPQWQFRTAMMLDTTASDGFNLRGVIVATKGEIMVLVTSLEPDECWQELVDQITELEKDHAEVDN